MRKSVMTATVIALLLALGPTGAAVAHEGSGEE